MKMRKQFVVIVVLACFILIGTGCSVSQTQDKTISTEAISATDSTTPTEKGTVDELVYENLTYGFRFKLPLTWKDFSVVDEMWTGVTADREISGPEIIIRNPNWTTLKPMQDIPLLIFTHEQWKDILDGKYNVSAAPIPPSLIGENHLYVFALPPRYNFAYPEGFEEVEEIMAQKPLEAFDLKN